MQSDAINGGPTQSGPIALGVGQTPQESVHEVSNQISFDRILELITKLELLVQKNESRDQEIKLCQTPTKRRKRNSETSTKNKYPESVIKRLFEAMLVYLTGTELSKMVNPIFVIALVSVAAGILLGYLLFTR
jgi:hypothetical protein